MTDTTTRYAEAFTASYDVLLDAVRAAGATSLGVTQQLLDEAQQAQRRNLALTRRVIENPADVAGNVNAFIEASAEAQTQALTLTRGWIERAPERTAEARALAERYAKANQELAGAAVAAFRDLYTSNPVTRAFGAA